MSAAWSKISADFFGHPKIIKAGRDGRDVFLFCICRNSALEKDGFIPDEYLEPSYLAHQLNIDETVACNGLKRCIVSSLLVKVDGGFQIKGWDPLEWGRGKSSTERVRKYRELKKKTANEAEGNVTPVSCNGETPKIRVDKIRVDKNNKSGVAQLLCEEGVAYLNNKIKSKYSPSTKETLRFFEALSKNKTTIDEIKTVVDFKHREWGTKPEMAKNLRPSTLFRPSNFSRYLDEAKGAPEKINGVASKPYVLGGGLKILGGGS